MLAMKDGRSFEGASFSVISCCGGSIVGQGSSDGCCGCSRGFWSSSSSESTGGLISQLTQTWLVAS